MPNICLTRTSCVLVWGCHHKYPRLGGLNSSLLSHSSEGWESLIGVPAWLRSDENFLSGLQVAAFSLYLHTAEREKSAGRKRDRLSVVSFYMSIDSIMRILPSWLHVNLITFQSHLSMPLVDTNIHNFSQAVNKSMHACVLSHFSHVWLFAILWTIARQASLSIWFSRQEYCSILSCPPPEGLPDPGIEPTSLMSPALSGRFFTTSAMWETLPKAQALNTITWKIRASTDEFWGYTIQSVASYTSSIK